jgi:hypothetical protein
VLSLGILLIGLVMRGGRVFRPHIAYLGIATGSFGLVSVLGLLVSSGSGVLVIVTSVLTTVWILLVGIQLYRLASDRE